MLRKVIIITIVMMMLAASVYITVAADKSKSDFKLWAGYVHREFDDTLGTAGEYQPQDSSIGLGLKYIGYLGNTVLSAYGYFAHEDDMGANFESDFNRVLKLTASYDRMTHNLLHDPMTNLQAVETPKATSHEDLNPDTNYHIIRSEFKAKARVKVPTIPWLKVEAGYRMEGRHGKKQSFSMSHCQNCHIVSQDRNVDQVTNDVEMKASISAGKFTAVYTFLGRDFEEKADAPTTTYQEALHPSKGVPVFKNRISYESTNGEMEYGIVPDSKKTKHNVKMQYNISCASSLQAGFTMSEVENSFTGNTANYNGYHGKLKFGLGAKANLSIRAKYYTLESDNYYVDIVEPPAPAGPHAGKTFRDVYGFDPDWTRMSAMDRSDLQLDAKLYYLLSKKSTLAASYQYKMEDRDNYFVTENDTETTKNIVKLRFNTRALKKASFSLSYKMAFITNPFVNVNGACTPNLEGGTAPSPLSPLSYQYYVLNDAKVADITNQPSQIHLLNGKLNWRPSGKFHVNANFKWNKSSNDELDYSEWNQDVMLGNLNLVLIPSPKFFTSLSYVYHKETDGAMFCIPVFDG